MAENDPQVWKAWYEEHGARLLLYSRQQTRSGADAEDVLQDAFVRMWKTAEKEPSLGLPNLPFAYTSIRRCAIDHARKTDRRKNREDLVQQDAPQETWFESDLESREQREIIQ
ncbi:MAG: sigma-70 family RNA polymerase sigma factor, partial [Verrucomicrobiota bacterium]